MSQPFSSVNGHSPQALQVPVDGSLQHFVVVPGDLQVPAQPLHRCQPDHPGRSGVAEAVVKGLPHLLHHAAQAEHQNVEDGVEHRHHQNLTGEHHAQHAEGVEKQHLPQAAGQGRGPGGAIHGAGRQQHRRFQRRGHKLHAQGHQQPRQVIGEKQALPPDGEAVEHPHRPGHGEIGEQRHGKEHAGDDTAEHAEVGPGVQQVPDQVPRPADGVRFGIAAEGGDKACHRPGQQPGGGVDRP